MIKVFSTPDCRFCRLAKKELELRGYKFLEVDLYASAEGMSEFKRIAPDATTVPQITINSNLIGGYDALMEVIDTPTFKHEMEKANG